MAASITPAKWQEWYHAISFTVPDDTTQYKADVRYYYMAAPPKAEVLQARQALEGAVQKLAVSYDRTAFQRTFEGKGSPDQIKHVLTMGVQSGAIADQAVVQKFADQFLGVDCSGFASQYLKYVGKITRNLWWIPGYKYSDNTNVRTSWDDVCVGDAVVWLRLDGSETKKPGHIALVADNEGGGNLVLVESNGSTIQGWPRGEGPASHYVRGITMDSQGVCKTPGGGQVLIVDPIVQHPPREDQ